jgi:hypothetical protein
MRRREGWRGFQKRAGEREGEGRESEKGGD